MGQVVRLVLLLGMAGYTYWKVGPVAAGALASEAVIAGGLVLAAFR